MSANAGYIGSCIGVWRRHCLSSITSEVSGLSELCKFHADSTRAQVRNLLSLALGKITYLQYNAGIEAILKIQDDTDTKLLKLAQEHDALVTVEENVVGGGAGSGVAELLAAEGVTVPMLHLGLPDHFIDHGDPAFLLSQEGLDAKGIAASIAAHFAQHQFAKLKAEPRVKPAA